MIYLLSYAPKKRKGLFSKFFSSDIEVSYSEIYGIDFCVITVLSEDEIDWRRVSKLVSGERIILPKAMNLADKIKLNLYDTKTIKLKLLTEGALEVICLASNKGAHLSVMLLDDSADYMHLIEPLLKSAELVTVITSKVDAYNNFAQEMALCYGATPIITSDPQTVGQSGIIIAPNGIKGYGALPLPSMIFAPTGCDCVTVRGSNIDSLNLGLPNDYDMLEFLAAIESQNGFDGKLPQLNSMHLRGEDVPLERLALQIAVKS